MSTRNRFPLWKLFSNVSVFGYRFRGIRGHGRQKRKETFAFSKENGYKWTGHCSKRVLFSCLRFKSLKQNVLTINACKDVIFMCLFRQLVDFEK